MGRVFTVDLRRVDPDVRRGQQSYPLAIDGTIYVTTNNNFVFALDGDTGKVKWEYRPRNSGLFVNFGVAANRGLAYCGGKLFMTTLDMQLVALRPSDGEVVGKIAISQFVPNASANYGYSQTSAPICAGGKVVMGAAGSEYGVRGYVMAFNTDLTPAWPNPYWTIPPEGTDSDTSSSAIRPPKFTPMPLSSRAAPVPGIPVPPVPVSGAWVSGGLIITSRWGS